MIDLKPAIKICKNFGIDKYIYFSLSFSIRAHFQAINRACIDFNNFTSFESFQCIREIDRVKI